MTCSRTRTPANVIAMTEVFVHPWDTASQQFARTRARHQISRSFGALLATLSLWLLILGLPGASRPAYAAEPNPADSRPVPQGPLNFDDCIRLAIHQSPYLTKSSVEIDIRRLDENDSRYSIFPPGFTFRTYYYVDRPRQFGLNPKPYSLSFTMDPYNPFGTYFQLQAQKMATQIAIYGHLQVINEGLARVGRLFLHLGATKRMAALQDTVINLSRENLIYAENRVKIGTGTTLEVKVAAQELELAKSERERLEISRRRALNNLKTFLGLKPEQTMELDLRDARRQVLGKFDPATTTLEEAKVKSYELKILQLKTEMQGYNITFAKTKILPSILFNTVTPDPLSVTTARGFYVGLGLEVPVWDGLKRIRNVSRQKVIHKQFGAERDMKEIDLSDKWNALQEDIAGVAATLKITQSQEELARLKERQAEIRYQSGGEPLPTWLQSRKANLEVQKSAANKALEHDTLILNLRQLSGDLGYSYVDQHSWQK